MKLSLLFILLSGSAAFSQISLTLFEYSGSGCPQGHDNVVMTPDGSAFSVLYDSFNLQVDQVVLLARSDCTITLHVQKPKKLGFQIEDADFRGFVALDAGVSASQKVQVMVGPNRGHQQLSAEFATQNWQGPISDNYALRAVRPQSKRPGILDCVPPRENTDIVINSQIGIANSGTGKFGQLTVDSVDGVIVQKFSLKLINCKN